MKELEDLKDVFKIHIGTLIYNKQHDRFNAIDKRLKALDIIVAKDVSCKMVELCKNAKQYNHFLEEQNYIYCHLEQEEFELIKEIL